MSSENLMKTSGVVVLLGILAGALHAQAPTVEYKRSFFAVGAAFTIGESAQTDNLGYGFSANGFQYLDPSRPFGFYYGFSASFMLHNAGGIQIADTRFLVIGWRGEMIAPWLGLDASLSPVAGARITGNLIQGTAYAGISPAVGLYVRCTPTIDVGLSYQPVVNLFCFGGAQEVRNKTYHDIVLSLSFRSFTEVKNLDWEEAASAMVVGDTTRPAARPPR
jgi:hypothetical protein